MPLIAETKPKRGRRTKAEIQQEAEALAQETREEHAYTNSKTEELQRQQEEQVRSAVKDSSVDVVVHRLSELQRDVSKTLSLLSDKLLAEVHQLTHLQQAVQLEQKELTRLHNVDVALTALDQLLEEYESQKEIQRAEEEKTRASWADEHSQREQETKEYQEALKRTRQREIEEYEYKKSLERKKLQDKYDEEQRLLERKNREQQEELEKGWKAREALIKAQEEDVTMLRKMVDEFPLRLKKEVEQAVALAVKQTEQKFVQETQLLKHESETEKRISALRIQTLEETIQRNAAQQLALQSQVEEAKKQVQEIAVKAIESASGAKTLSHINQIAMEQAKNRASQG